MAAGIAGNVLDSLDDPIPSDWADNCEVVCSIALLVWVVAI